MFRQERFPVYLLRPTVCLYRILPENRILHVGEEQSQGGGGECSPCRTYGKRTKLATASVSWAGTFSLPFLSLLVSSSLLDLLSQNRGREEVKSARV